MDRLWLPIWSRSDLSYFQESARGQAHSRTLARWRGRHFDRGALGNVVSKNLKKANEFGGIQVNPTESNLRIYDLRMTINEHAGRAQSRIDQSRDLCVPAGRRPALHRSLKFGKRPMNLRKLSQIKPDKGWLNYDTGFAINERISVVAIAGGVAAVGPARRGMGNYASTYVKTSAGTPAFQGNLRAGRPRSFAEVVVRVASTFAKKYGTAGRQALRRLLAMRKCRLQVMRCGWSLSPDTAAAHCRPLLLPSKLCDIP